MASQEVGDASVEAGTGAQGGMGTLAAITALSWE